MNQAPQWQFSKRMLHALHLVSCCEPLCVPMSSCHRNYMQKYLIKRTCHAFDSVVQDQNFTNGEMESCHVTISHVGLFSISTCFTITRTKFTFQEFPVLTIVSSNSVSIIFARELVLELWEVVCFKRGNM